MADNQNHKSNPKKNRGAIKEWIIRVFFILPLFWSVLGIAHTLVQFPEDRASTFCKHTYNMYRFFWFDIGSFLAAASPKTVFKISEDTVDYKIACDSRYGYFMTSIIPNIHGINLRGQNEQ